MPRRMRRELLLLLIEFLSNPMTRFTERQFRQFLARYQTHKDIKGLVDAVCRPAASYS